MSVEVLKQIWPEWQIEGKPLGKGSFGVVYKAVRRDHGVESYAAIKVISIPTDPSEVDSLRSEGLDMNATRTYLQGIVNDFVSEIQLMESLKGVQNIVSVEDYKVVEKSGEIGWDIYIRMELLTSFNAYICDKKLTEEEVIKLGCDICTALEICAKRNIIHRDIKPENIFINDFGYFKLGDFGIARKMENMTGGLSQKGTFNYMAPEVANSSDYDARVDTYSLGIVLYRLLNGNRLPFLDTEKQLLNPNERRNAVDRRLHGEELPAPCDASPAMADLILRACAYDPNMRFTSATEMKQALMSVANGTYQIGASNLDRTTSVRKAADSYDRTTSVRKAPAASNQKSAPAVNTFGSTPKKKSKMPTVIAAVLAVVLLVGVGIFAVETADYSKFDEEQIASIISEAESLASEEDYEGAIVKVQTGLVTYPKSAELQDKADEYTEALNAQIKIKAKTLDEAKTLADFGDYVSAIALIKNAQETQGDDADYQAALKTYSAAYKTEVITSADGLAANGDYFGALEAVGTASAVIGDDAELSEKATEYENAYALDISAQVDALLATNDIVAAKALLQSAAKEFPNNETIKSRIEELNTYKTVSLSSLSPTNGSFTWNDGVPGDPFGNSYSALQNYVILHSEYSSWDGHGGNTATHSVEYQVGKKYDTLSFTLVPYSEFGENGWSYLRIYVDDVLRYTSDRITQKTQPHNISVDISDAEYIEIIVYTDEFSCTMITDVLLSKLPNYVSSQASGYTSLSAVDIFNGSLPWENDFPCDTLKSAYNNVCNYAVLHAAYSSWDGHGGNAESYSAEYYVNKQYLSLSFDIAPAGDFGASGYTSIKVYADDVLVYTSPAISQKTARFNTGDIDISQASYIKIVAEVDEHSCTIISDVLLKNAES